MTNVSALAGYSSRWAKFLAAAGPGLVVMLADADPGSVITGAQSGARWGYRLLLQQVVRVPVGGEFLLKPRAVFERAHDNAVARRNDQALREKRLIHRCVVPAGCR